MLIVMRQGHSEKDVVEVLDRLSNMGLTGHVSQGVERTVIGVVGQTSPQIKDTLETWPTVDEVVPISKPYKLACREFKPEPTTIKVGNVIIGGNKLAVITGGVS